jgi:hypothetical protein
MWLNAIAHRRRIVSFPLRENISMARHFLAFSAFIALLSMFGATGAPAQTTPAATKADTLGSIQTSIIRTVGAQPNTVVALMRGDVLIVTRANSNMNDTTHEGRNSEAKAIASTVSKVIGTNTRFTKVSTIRVEYISRKPTDRSGKVVDTVEFRKGPDGVFDFHQT